MSYRYADFYHDFQCGEPKGKEEEEEKRRSGAAVPISAQELKIILQTLLYYK